MPINMDLYNTVDVLGALLFPNHFFFKNIAQSWIDERERFINFGVSPMDQKLGGDDECISSV